MAFAKLTMEHPHLGKIKQAPVGFSWTCFFFGFWVPLFRGHFLAALGWFAIELVLGSIGVMVAGYWESVYVWATVITIVMGFLYNKQYLRHLIREGFKSTNRPVTIETIERKLEMKIPVHAGQDSANQTTTDRVDLTKPAPSEN